MQIVTRSPPLRSWIRIVEAMRGDVIPEVVQSIQKPVSILQRQMIDKLASVVVEPVVAGFTRGGGGILACPCASGFSAQVRDAAIG